MFQKHNVDYAAIPSPQVKAHFGLDYESRVRGKNEVLLYGNFSDPKGGKVRREEFVSKTHLYRRLQACSRLFFAEAIQ